MFCTFHQAFAYEEFVEGLRANTDDNGNVRYAVEAGVFKALALAAAAEGLSTGEGESWEMARNALQQGTAFHIGYGRLRSR